MNFWQTGIAGLITFFYVLQVENLIEKVLIPLLEEAKNFKKKVSKP